MIEANGRRGLTSIKPPGASLSRVRPDGAASARQDEGGVRLTQTVGSHSAWRFTNL